MALQKVRLLIIDEVHLLNDERGAVIETIVARTLRQVSFFHSQGSTSKNTHSRLQVESSQSVIRIVGLSATLPNYVDVSDFLYTCQSHVRCIFNLWTESMLTDIAKRS